MPEESESLPSVPVASDISEAHSEFLAKFDKYTSTPAQGQVDGLAQQGSEINEPIPGGQKPSASDALKQEPEKQAPPTKPDPKTRDRELEAKLREDRDLQDYVQRQLQSTRDKTIADLNKRIKVTQTVDTVRSANPAFAQDWESLPPDNRQAWIEAQPEFDATVKGVVQDTMRQVVTDLMELLGADESGITDEMVGPQGRDQLRNYLLSGAAMKAETERVRKEAFEAGKAAGRSEDRGLERRPPTGTAGVANAPVTMAEAHKVFMEGLDRLGV